MAVTTDVEIANLALAQLGQDSISSIDNSSRDSKAVLAVFDQNQEYCTGLYDWVSLTYKIHLVRAGLVTITAATAAAPPVVTCSGHEFVTGDLVTVEDCNGMTEINDGRYVVFSYTSSTITLYDTEGVAVSGTTWTAYTSGGYAYYDAGHDWDYIYSLPAGCHKILQLLDDEFGASDETWEQQKTHLYCNLQYAGVKYLKKDTTVANYDEQLVELMATRLAWLIAPKVTSDETIRRDAYQNWLTVSMKARMTNALKKVNRPVPENLWTKVR